MALGTQTNKIFLSVSEGKIVRKVAEGTADAVAFTKKDGGVIWQQRFAFVSGILTGISTKTGEFNGSPTKDFVFELTDNGEHYAINMPYDGRNAVSLIKALCNPVVDFSKPITITPWLKVVDGKKKMSCFLKQGDADIKWYFTKEETHGMPELEMVMLKGKETWDNFKQMQFLEKFINDNVKPKLSAPVVGLQSEPAFTEAVGPDNDFIDEYYKDQD